eukprot:639298-Pyramimonas_sp.AAC.1
MGSIVVEQSSADKLKVCRRCLSPRDFPEARRPDGGRLARSSRGSRAADPNFAQQLRRHAEMPEITYLT